jgi:quercetin dioxygenase-like cupin family protein
MTKSPYTFIPSLFEQLPEIPADTIVSRTVYDDAQVKVVLFGFAPGQELSEHTAAQAAVLYFLGGEAGLTLGSEALDVQAGTWVHMPARLPHSIKARTPVQMLLYLLKSHH